LKKVTKTGKILNIQFSLPPQEFSAVLAMIKRIDGRSWNPTAKTWMIPDEERHRETLREWGFILEDEFPTEVPELPEMVEPQKEFDERVLSSLPYKLRPYQITACKFLEANNWNGALSLGMRLGKTAVALAGTLIHPDALPCVILTTSTGKSVWQNEIKKWLGDHHTVTVLEGLQPYAYPESEFIILNYTIIPAWADYLIERGFTYFCVDEFHAVSNDELTVQKTKEEYNQDLLKKSTATKTKKVPVQCTEAFKKMSIHSMYNVFLSGTPMTKCPAQLRIPLSVFVPQFENKYWYLKKFCDPRHDGYGWKYEGLSHKEVLFPILNQWIFRRTKQDVFTDLPQEQHQFIPIEVDTELYERELTTLKRLMEREHLTEEEVEHKISQFESLSYTQKRTKILSWIREFLDTGNKLTVFAWHKNVIEDLHKAFKKESVVVWGATESKDRVENIRKFNEDPKTKLFIGQIKSAMEAITLSGSDTVAYVELPFTAGQLQQSAERIWVAESGQEKLFYYYFTAKDTIDELRVEVLRERAKLLSDVLDKGKGSVFGTSLRDLVLDKKK